MCPACFQLLYIPMRVPSLQKMTLLRQFIACKGNALAAKRLFRTLARTLHPDKGGSIEEFQALEDIYTIAKKGRSGL